LLNLLQIYNYEWFPYFIIRYLPVKYCDGTFKCFSVIYGNVHDNKSWQWILFNIYLWLLLFVASVNSILASYLQLRTIRDLPVKYFNGTCICFFLIYACKYLSNNWCWQWIEICSTLQSVYFLLMSFCIYANIMIYDKVVINQLKTWGYLHGIDYYQGFVWLYVCYISNVGQNGSLNWA
jgi:hypothetical protein